MLLKQARIEELSADGSVEFSDGFLQNAAGLATQKLAAPDVVKPVQNLSVEAAITRLDENQKRFDRLRELFAIFDSTQHKYPHPYLGPISAQEWLFLRGQHEARHIKQMEKVVEK
ncbi:MAG: DinB family protein, partial [Acidobacteria bacterium]|nr:DinB family protein [Acidobacteriota bacterium]